MELLISLLFLLAAGFVLMLILHKLNSDTIKWLREENDRLKTQTKLARRED